jgi:hypothetical protein
MRSPSSRDPLLHLGKWLAALALASVGCGGNDYYYLNDIKGEGDTVLFDFIYTCGQIEMGWDGAFLALPHYIVELVVKHDDQGNDCEVEPREIPFDVGPIKRSFRKEHAWPTPLGLRVAPYEEEHGAVCLDNLFQDVPFKGKRCK